MIGCMAPGLDVIGDIHGHAGKLVTLLRVLGYDDSSGVWRHEHRQAVFVGDLIDRGPGQLETLRIVRRMVDASAAKIVLGNHEFNAVAYATVDPDRLDYCRTHDAKHDAQHRSFIDEVGFDTPLHRAVVEWFRTIPLWLELGGVNVVHACWSAAQMRDLDGVLGPGNTLSERAVIAGARRGNEVYDAIEVLLKGPEIALDGAWYLDKDGNRREQARARWWASPATVREAAWIPPRTQLLDAAGTTVDELPARPLRRGEIPINTSDVPVLVGHYWWRRDFAEPALSTTWACVDYSVAADGQLAAYRWNDGDTELQADQLEFV